MLYVYKRSHRGTRMTVIPQLIRKLGRPLPKHTSGGLGDALGQLPGLADVSQVFQELCRAELVAAEVSAPTKQPCSGSCISPLAFLLKLR